MLVKRIFISLFILGTTCLAEAAEPDWYVVAYQEASRKEFRYKLKSKNQILRFEQFQWKCLSPPAKSEYGGKLWIRTIQCGVPGSGLMIGGTATCILPQKNQPGSLNIALHQGMKKKSRKFEFDSDHDSLSLTLECRL